MNKRLLLSAVVLAVCGMLFVSNRTPVQGQLQTPTHGSCGAAPTVTLDTVQVANTNCGTEQDCIQVKWSANAPAGTVLTGFKVDLNLAQPSGQAVNKSLDVGANTREAIVPVFHVTGPQGLAFKAKVTAKYQSCVAANKAGML